MSSDGTERFFYTPKTAIGKAVNLIELLSLLWLVFAFIMVVVAYV